MNFKKMISYILVIIFVCSVSFFTGAKITNHKRDTENRLIFLNRIYSELYHTIHLLSSVEDWGDSIETTDSVINPYRQLLAHLDSMIVISEQGLLYMRNEQNSSCLKDFSKSLTIVKHAIDSGVSLNNQTICNNFLDDGVLSESEISFLGLFREDLKNIKDDLFSEETNQENKTLTFQDLRNILKKFTDTYKIINIYNLGLQN